MRHEQSASYAAQAVGYLTGRPGACLVVSGPGMTNAISGLANAWSNCWPMILHRRRVSDISQDGMGAFQEAPQVEAARPFTQVRRRGRTASTRSRTSSSRRCGTSIYGRPGAAYLDLPGDIITGKCDEDAAPQRPRVPDAAAHLRRPGVRRGRASPR